jgi:hypothetical protein
MSMTFQKRQKELKRQEKQRAKAEKRELRKAAKRAEQEQGTTTTLSQDTERLPHGHAAHSSVTAEGSRHRQQAHDGTKSSPFSSIS